MEIDNLKVGDLALIATPAGWVKDTIAKISESKPTLVYFKEQIMFAFAHEVYEYTDERDRKIRNPQPIT